MPTIKKSGTISVLGKCYDCDMTWNSPATAMLATKHHQETGHHIRVEQHLFWERKTAPGTKPSKPKKRKTRKRKK